MRRHSTETVTSDESRGRVTNGAVCPHDKSVRLEVCRRRLPPDGCSQWLRRCTCYSKRDTAGKASAGLGRDRAYGDDDGFSGHGATGTPGERHRRRVVSTGLLAADKARLLSSVDYEAAESRQQVDCAKDRTRDVEMRMQPVGGKPGPAKVSDRDWQPIATHRIGADLFRILCRSIDGLRPAG